LSDGVLEAQSPTGELFGFDRTRSISMQSAAQIAKVAQRFGQQDDIPVLNLSFAPPSSLRHRALPKKSKSPSVSFISAAVVSERGADSKSVDAGPFPDAYPGL
jgi:hypothetical protein